MPAPTSSDDFLDLVRKSGLIEVGQLRSYLRQGPLPGAPAECGSRFVQDGLLTNFQVQQLLTGKYMGFSLGRYRVLEPLGTGAMDAVYLCRDPKGRLVAVKVLPKALAKDATLLKRFQREARASIALDHPNIVRGFETEHDRDLHFFVMEYVDGVGLHDLVARSGPLPVPRAAHYIRQAAVGLQYAHEQGLIHRDIKPGNFLVDRLGAVKVLDMGLSRFSNDDDEVLTRDFVVGTIEFLAPEQARDSHDVDPRADIYGLGGTFYYLLAGQPPFSNEAFDPKDLKSRRPKPLSRLRHDVPPTLVEIIEKMMEPDPGRRFASMAEVVQALASFTQTPIPPPTDQEIPKPGEWLKLAGAAPLRRRRWLAAALVAVTSLAVLAAWLAFFRG